MRSADRVVKHPSVQALIRPGPTPARQEIQTSYKSENLNPKETLGPKSEALTQGLGGSHEIRPVLTTKKQRNKVLRNLSSLPGCLVVLIRQAPFPIPLTNIPLPRFRAESPGYSWIFPQKGKVWREPKNGIRTHIKIGNGRVARDLPVLQGARRKNILYGSSTDEQRSSNGKDRQPGGLFSGGRLTALLLSSRPVGTAIFRSSRLASRPPENSALIPYFDMGSKSGKHEKSLFRISNERKRRLLWRG